MIVVDSSIWSEFFRGRNETIVERVRALLDADEVALAAPVRLEILSGASKADLPTLRRVLSALPLLLPSPTIWTQLEGWLDRASRAGERFGTMDLLIAGIAHEHGATVWSGDADFRRLAKLGFVKLYR